jgi:hypothetical protein
MCKSWVSSVPQHEVIFAQRREFWGMTQDTLQGEASEQLGEGLTGASHTACRHRTPCCFGGMKSKISLQEKVVPEVTLS